MQTTTPEMGTIPRYTSTSTAHPERIAITPAIERQQAIENHLSTALWHVRNATGNLSIQAATGRVIRAATLLKLSCSESVQIGGAK